MKSAFLSADYRARLAVQVNFETLSMLAATGKAVLDAAYLSRGDSVALAAFGIAFPCMLVIDGLGQSQSMAASSLAAGVFDPRSPHYGQARLLHGTLTIALVAAAALMLLYGGAGALLLAFGTGAWHELGRFLAPYAFAIPFLGAAAVARASLRCVGAERAAACLNMLSLGASSALAWALTLGQAGMPALGIGGVAAGIVLNAVLTSVGFFLLLRGRTGIGFGALAINGAFLRRHCAVMLPSLVNNFTSAAFAAALVLLFARLGRVEAAAYALIARIEVFLLIFCAANATSFIPFYAVSRQHGEGERMRAALAYVFKRLTVTALVVALACAAGAAWLAPLLGGADTALYPLLHAYFLILPLAYGLQTVFILHTLLLIVDAQGWQAWRLNLVRLFAVCIPLVYAALQLAGFMAGLATLALVNGAFGLYALRQIRRRAHAWRLPVSPILAKEV